MRTRLVGVGLGTMGTKAAIFDADGHMLGSAYEESRFHNPQPGWAGDRLLRVRPALYVDRPPPPDANAYQSCQNYLRRYYDSRERRKNLGVKP